MAQIRWDSRKESSKSRKKYTSPPPKKTKKQKQWKKCGQYLSNGEREGNPQNVWEVFHPPFVVLSRPFSSLALRGCGESLWPVWSSVGFTPWVGRGSCERPCCCKLLFFLVHKLLSKLQKNNIMFFVFVWPFGCIGLKAGFTVCFFICYVGLWIIVANSVTNVVTNDLLTSQRKQKLR